MSQRAAAVAKPSAAVSSAAAAPLRPPAAAPLEPAAAPARSPFANALRPADGGEPPRDFAHLDIEGRRPRRDADEARSLLTQLLLQELAPALGLDLSRVKVVIGPQAEARINAAGALALQEGSNILLHPAHYRPQSDDGRYLLAHEAVHAAQRALQGQADAGAAEREAEQIGRDFAQRRVLRRPRIALAAHGRAAAADGAVPEAAATKPTPALTESVKASRSRELAVIKNAISGWWISDGDVDTVMNVLDDMDFATAVALVGCLSGDERYHLADNINPVHIKSHRASVLACYQALDANRFNAIDTDVLEELPMSGLSPEERIAAQYTLQHIARDDLADLLQSGARVAIKRLIMAPVFSDEEAKEIGKRAEDQAKKEAASADARREILGYADDKSVAEVLTKVRDALRPAADVAGGTPRTHPLRALEALQAETGNGPRFACIAELLEQQGLTSMLLHDLPPQAFAKPGERTDVLVELLKARLPSQNQAYLEELLSYGLFDWAVRDHEAEFAYRLLTVLPLPQQYRFRQRDNGKWFMRLMNNLPSGYRERQGYHDIEVRKVTDADRKQLESEGVEIKDGLYDAGKRYRAKLEQDPVTAHEWVHFKADFAAADEEGFPLATAQNLLHRLAVLGNPTLDGKAFTPGDDAVRETIVRELDARGYIDKLFAALPESELYSEALRETTVKIMLSRDAARAQSHARELVSRHFFSDWMVKDREAYLAFLVVKALPDDERKSFIENDPTSWGRVQSEMSESMRRSHALNMYVGDKAGLDRASVLGQLAQAATWTGDNAVTLAGLLNMAMAMTEHRFAFERSKEFKAWDTPGLEPLVKRYRLYHEHDGPKTYEPEMLKGTRWYEEGVFDTLRTLGKGLLFLWNNDLLLVKRSAGANRLDLNELQGLAGGDIGGLHLADPAEAGKDPKAPKPDPDANTLDLHVDLGAHALSLHLPELLIDSSNIQGFDSTIQTGGIRMKGLRIEAAYDTEQFEQPTAATLTFDSLEVDDLLLAGRAGMTAVTHLLVTALRVAAGSTDTTTKSQAKPRGGWYFPIPFLMTIGTAIYYLFKFKGWGTETPTQNVGHGLEQIKAADFSFGKAEVQGLTTSGGQSVRSIKVADFALRVGLNRATLTRARIASLDQRIKALGAKPGKEATVAALKTEREKAEVDLQNMLADERFMLEAQQKIQHGGLNQQQQDDLQREINDRSLDWQGGAFVDVGHIEMSGVSGTLTSEKPIVMDNVHGEAQSGALSSALGLGVITDSALISRAAAGSPSIPLVEQAGDATLKLEIDEFNTGRLEIGGGLVLGSAELEAQMKELEEVRHTLEFGDDYRQLEHLRDQALLYEQYALYGVSSLDAGQLATFRQLRAELIAKPTMVIQSIALTRASLDVNLISGRIGVGADEARIKGIELTRRKLVIDEVYGKNLSAGATAAGGLAGWLEWRKNLTGADARADLLRFSGVHDGKSGIGARSITVTGLGAKVDRNGNNASAHLEATRIEAEGVSIAFTERLLRVQLEQLRKKTVPLSKAETLKVKAIEFLLSDYQRVQRMIADAQAEVQASAKDGALHLQWANEQMQQWQRNVEVKKLSVRDLNIDVSGLGDILDENYSFASATASDKGVTLAGGGPNGQIISGATISTVFQNQPWAQEKKDAKKKQKKGVVDDAPPQYEEGYENVSADQIEIGAVRGSVSYADDHIALNSFGIDSLVVSNLAYMTGGMSIVVSGSATLTGLSVTARINTPLVDDAKPKGERRMSGITVTHFGIDAIELSGGKGHYLDYQDHASGLWLTLTKGKLGGIRADGVMLDFPADPKAGMLVRGGSAGLDSVEGLQLAARTGSGLFFDGLLNAKTLKADFAESGAIKATLDEFSLANGHLRSGDLDAKLKASGEGLRVQLLPGEHGYGDGVKKLGANSLSASAKGKSGTTTFDAELNKASFDVTDDGKTIDIKALKIPDIKLHQFHLGNDKFVIDVPQGETIEVVGLELDATLERNLDPKSKDESSLDRILIRNFRVPYILTRGMDITLVQKGITLHLDKGISGGLSDLYMAPDASNPEGFLIKPNEGWKMLGSAGMTKATLVHLRASMAGVFDAAARVKADGLSVGFFNDGSTEFDLEKLLVSDIDVTMAAKDPSKATKFSTLVGRTRHSMGGAEPGLYAEGIHGKMGKDADGKDTFEASARKAGLRGFRMDMPEAGVTLDIRQLELPQGAEMPSMGNVVIPEANISDAYFKIDDILHMGPESPDKKEGPPSKIDPGLLNFLDSLNGMLDVTIHVPMDYLASQKWYVPTIQEDFRIQAYIRNGTIDFAKLEDKLLDSALLDNAIDFEIDDDVLYVQIDLKTFGALFGLAGVGGGALGGSKLTDKYLDKARWKLDRNDPKGDEVEMAEKYSRVRLRTLAKPFLPDGTSKPKDPNEPEPEWGKMLHDFEVRINTVNLSLLGRSSIDLAHLNKSGLSGKVILGGVGVDGVSGLTVSGNSKTGLGLGLDEANVALEDLKIETDTKKLGVNTGTIHIGKLNDASLSFGKGTKHLGHLSIMPKTLEGTVSEASVKDLRVNWADKPPADPAKQGTP